MRKKEVLRGNKDVNRVYKRGRSLGEKYVVVFFLKNELDYKRVAFIASKKVGNSVQRNRARRLMKEGWREISGQVPEGYDLIFIARNSINGRKCREVSDSLIRGLQKAKLIRKKEEQKVRR